MAAFLRIAWLIMRKDFTIEVRSREILYTTVFFAVSCVLVFAFSFVRDGRLLDDAAAGILWIAIAFAGTLALGRTFERERHGETLRALLMAPADRPAIYLGKLLGILALMGAVELLIVPLVGLLFQAPILARPWLLLGLLVTGTVGFAAVGTLFAGMVRMIFDAYFGTNLGLIPDRSYLTYLAGLSVIKGISSQVGSCHLPAPQSILQYDLYHRVISNNRFTPHRYPLNASKVIAGG